MRPAEFELWTSFREARAMDHTGARTALLEEVVRRADRADVPRAAFLSRRLLADAHRLDGRWDLTYRLFHECLELHDRRPRRFEPEDRVELLRWYARLVECMVDFPEFALDRITAALEDVERRFRAAGLNLHEVHSARRGVAAHLGDWDAAEHAHLRWTATADADADDRWLHLAAIEQLLARGDEVSLARAHELAAQALADPTTSDEPTVLTRSLMLLPLARAGRWEQAVPAYRRLLRGMSGAPYSLEDHGRVVEFCALTGNEDAGLDWLGPAKGFQSRKRPLATMEFAASLALLADRLVRAGRGETALDLGDDPNSAPFRVLADRMRRAALDLADRFDRRNGTTARGDRVRARLAAAPLAGFVPLGPTSRRPLRLPPPPGLPAEALLDRAHRHDLRCEPDEARACLAALPVELPEHLAARRAELRATSFQGTGTEPALRHAVEVHRRFGDERRAQLTRCRLALWVVHCGRPEEGVALASDAVGRLRALGGDGDCAWGEHWLAHVLLAVGRRAEAHRALRRGRRHAEAAGDRLALGSLLGLESAVHPEGAITSATAALEAFLAADAPEKALEALERLRTAHHRLGDPAPLGALVDRLLARPLPASAHRLLGHLRHLRARAAIDAGRPADAVDDLNEAIGQASLRNADTVEQWYQLAHANHAAGRYEDAVDAGLRAAAWLDRLREEEGRDWAEWADQARYLVAEGHRLLGDARAALREYRALAEGRGPLAAAAFIAGSALLEELGDGVRPG